MVKFFRMKIKIIIILITILIFSSIGYSQSSFTIARLKYRGGGDWYNDPSAIPNLLKFIKDETNIATSDDEKKLDLLSEELFTYPVLFMTGHGKIIFSDEEAVRLRKYLISGGFLYADDDYGMDSYFRSEIKKVFPDKKLIEIPFSHPIYFYHFEFPNGLPKIHEHDGGTPKGFGIFHEGRLVVFYSFNTNISDGWPDAQVHGDPEEKRLEAFKMGTNIFVYALTN